MDSETDNDEETKEAKSPFKKHLDIIEKCLDQKTIDDFVVVRDLAREDDGTTFSMEMRTPALLALLAWDEVGFVELSQIVEEQPKVTPYVFAIQLYSTLAAGHFPSSLIHGISEPLMTKLRLNCRGKEVIATIARQHLTRLLMQAPDDEIALRLGVALMPMSEPDVIKQLLQAIAARYSSVGLPIVAEFEALIETSPNSEPTFQEFLTRNPLVLDPYARRVWPQPDLHGKKEPDFIIQRSDGSYLVVEIETPGKQLVTQDFRLSSKVSEAKRQVLEYREFLPRNFGKSCATFPEFRVPDCLVVIGLEGELNPRQSQSLRNENDSGSFLKVVGYDALAMRSKDLIKNVIETDVIVELGKRLK